MHQVPGMTEHEVLIVIEKVALLLSKRFSLPGYDHDDIASESRIMALECLPRYDPRPDESGNPTRPLENFVWTNGKLRMVNLIRDRFRRADAPCKACHRGEPCDDGQQCKKYRVWRKRNNAKASLLGPVSMETLADKNEPRSRVVSTVESDAEMSDLERRIDEAMPVGLRAAYLMMRANKAVAASKRAAVQGVVQEILDGPS